MNTSPDHIASRRAQGAVGLCIAGAFLATCLTATLQFLPVTGFLLLILGLLMAHFCLRGDQPIYDPGVTFVTFISCFVASRWILDLFFVGPAVGPYAPADLRWTVPNMLGSVAFGFILPVLVGATVGLTYVAARRTTRVYPWTRALVLAFALGIPLFMVLHMELSAACFQALVASL